jgi:hypothetical protein
MTDDLASSGRKQTGSRFKPGQSGNPKGRPLGSRNAALVALDQIAEGAAPAMLATLVQAGMSGDVQAARLVMERAWPARKGRAVVLDMPAITDAAGVTEAIARLIKATTTGSITPDEAAPIAALIEGQRKAIETNHLESRIAALEKNHADKP